MVCLWRSEESVLSCRGIQESNSCFQALEARVFFFFLLGHLTALLGHLTASLGHLTVSLGHLTALLGPFSISSSSSLLLALPIGCSWHSYTVADQIVFIFSVLDKNHGVLPRPLDSSPA